MQTADDRSILISTMPATSRDRTAALAVVAVSLVLFACAVPFATVPLVPMPAFVASYQSALAINDLITAVLLFSQFAILRSRALLLLASGYLFTAVAAIAHALTFPGLFAPTGLLHAGPQTTVWLYMIWHGGFPLLALGYALLRDADGGAKVRTSTGRAILGSIIAVGIAISALTWFVTARHDILPTLLSGGQYTAVMIGVVSRCGSQPRRLADAVVSATAYRRRRLAHGGDVCLAVRYRVVGDPQRARFDLGFYAGRIFGLCAASFVLAVLLDRHPRPARPRSPACSQSCAGRPPRNGIVTPSASGCSARWWNPPTTPSSRRLLTATSPAGTRPRNVCSGLPRRKPSAITST